MNFNQSLQQQLAQFEPYLNAKVFTAPNAFSQQKASVAFFIKEIELTAAALAQAQQTNLAEFYADKLLRQFKTLKNAVEKYQNQPKKQSTAVFRSKYHFPRNIHNLPEERRLVEYKKALKALDEKMAWLTEQYYQADGDNNRALQDEIQATEYRRNKCLAAINELA